MSSFNCPICDSKCPISDSITLTCDHKFCEECLSYYILSSINQNQFYLNCPENGCEKEIEISIL